MPLKPIFEKAPLTGAVRLPMRPGQLMLQDDCLDTLLALAEKAGAQRKPMLWEGMLRASALTLPHAEQLPVAQWIRDALTDVSSDIEQLPVMRAAWALYELTADKELLSAILQWVGNLAADWEQVTGDASLRRSPADMMELLVNLYRVTGKKPLLRLMEQLRQHCMNWAGILHTFSVQQPMSKIIPVKQLLQGMSEEDSEEGFYTRQALTCHGMTLADGARATVMNGIFSGNGQELSAAVSGWERISRYHGAVCGGISCDELLAGNAPSASVDACALGAWMEALCAAMQQNRDASLWNQLALIRANALPKALMGGKLHLMQQVNALKPDAGDKSEPVVLPLIDRQELALARLLRGTSAMLSHAVTLTPDGVALQLPVSGKVSLRVNSKPVVLTLEAAADGLTASVSCKEPAAFRMRLRMPDHVTDGVMKVSRGGTAACDAGAVKEATRSWENGDTVTMSWKPALRTVSGYHQGMAVYLGDTLMAMPDHQSVATAGEPVLQEDRVLLPVKDIDNLRVSKQVIAILPVLPAAKGETRLAELLPYEACCGMAFFPKGSGC